MRPPVRSLVPTRRPRIATVCAAVALGAVVGVPSAQAQGDGPAAKAPHVLTTSSEGFMTKLGPVRVNARNATLANAYRVFGKPSSATGRGSVRRVQWKKAGVSVVGVTFGLCRRKACRTNELYIQTARVSGPRWQTAAGLRIGDPASRIAELYPDAEPPSDGSGGVVVQEAFSQIGDPGDIPIITAKVARGVVSGFVVFVGAAGD